MNLLLRLLLLPTMLAAAGCSDGEASRLPVEVVQPAAWREELIADGEIKAAQITALNVPGSGFEGRRLLDMVADGSVVRKGQVIARFEAARARLELSQAELELLRIALEGSAQRSAAAVADAQLATDLAQVDSDLGLSQRYVAADVAAFSRNQILDALQDVGFLNLKRGFLDWQRAQGDRRGAAQLAVIDSRRDSSQVLAEQKRNSLQALDLKAPHDGVFMLNTRWDGSKPQVGGNQYAGDDFATLPDLGSMLARMSVPQTQAFALAVGQAVRVRLAGTGVEIDSRVARVSSTATVKSRDSPVKYIEVDAELPQSAIDTHGLRPGQAVRSSVILVDIASTITLPNIALRQRGDRFEVLVADAGEPRALPVQVGVRGPIRTQIIGGLTAGTPVILTPDASGSSP